MKSILLYIFLIALNVHNSLIGQPSDYKFLHLTSDDGLTDNYIQCILQDNKGFIWFGSRDGLNRFDGYEFKVFRHTRSDPRSISNNYISCMTEDEEGNLWIGTDQGGVMMYDYRNDIFKTYKAKANDSYTLPSNVIWDIFTDSENNIWIGCYLGICRFDKEKNSFQNYKLMEDNGETFNDHVVKIKEDKLGRIWLATYNSGLYLLEKKTGEFTHYRHNSQDLNSIASDQISQLFIDSKNFLWIGTRENGLDCIDLSTMQVRHYKYNPSDKTSINGNAITSIYETSDGNILIGVENGGLNIFNRANGNFTHLKKSDDDVNSLNNNTISCILESKCKTIWLGTNGGGINYIPGNIKPIELYNHKNNDSRSLSFNTISSFMHMPDGFIWIGTDGGGIDVFDPIKKEFSITRRNYLCSLVKSKVILAMIKDEKLVWIGTWDNGLYEYNIRTNKIKLINYTDEKNKLSKITTLENDGTYLWIGTLGEGIFILDKESGMMYSRYRKQGFELNFDFSTHLFVTHIIKDTRGHIWIGTAGGGLYRYNRKSLQHYMYNEHQEKSLSGNHINVVFEDSKGNIWVGTNNGLNRYMLEVDGFEFLTTNIALPNDLIYGIEEDNSGSLWVSTNKGIAKFNTLTGKVNAFDKQDGLQGLQFYPRAIYKDPGGFLYFGGYNGFNRFHPDSIKENSFIPPIIITDFKLFGISQKVGSKVSKLRYNINITKEITLNHDDNTFSFHFSALNFIASKKNQYQYMLEGFDKKWNVAGTDRSATYTNIDVGTYRFKVKGSNNDGIWNEVPAEIIIKIKPPIYKTRVSYLIYFILTILILYFVRKMIILRERSKRKIEIERIEARKRHEIDEMRLRFYTNVSHELRTPLSLVLAPLEKLIHSGKTLTPEKIESMYLLMHRNVKRLQFLVNQIMDLQKMDYRSMKLVTTKDDIVAFTKNVAYSFYDLAEQKNIKFEFSAIYNVLIIDFDRDKLEKVLINLLSNAFKFTKENGMIKLNLAYFESQSINDNELAKEVEITVSDSGVGIPQSEIGKIFNRFYQLDYNDQKGTGIGLAHTKELVEIMKGKISVESSVGKGTIVKVRFPVSSDIIKNNSLYKGELLHYSHIIYDESDKMHIARFSEKKLAKSGTNQEKPLVLIVEDNQDLRVFIKENLQIDYRVVEAQDGLEGWDRTLAQLPDLVICDVMMPRMDGIQLCQKIKNDERTSHIPVILLTAKTSEENMMEGFTVGADAYIPKPFNFQLLELRIKKILEIRKRLRERFLNKIDIKPQDITIVSLDDKFLQKAIKIVEDNLGNYDFTTEEFSKIIGLSRMHLYRKLISLTQKTPSEFIKTMRLKRAIQLLQKSQLTISEIAYSVGFKEVSTFSKLFKKEFGVFPSKYRNFEQG